VALPIAFVGRWPGWDGCAAAEATRVKGNGYAVNEKGRSERTLRPSNLAENQSG